MSAASIPKLPVAHQLPPGDQQFEARWSEYVEKKAARYCAQGHDFVDNGPMFICGRGRWRDEVDIHHWTACSRCHIRPEEAVR